MKILALAENVAENSTPNRLRLALIEEDVEFKIYAATTRMNDANVIEIKGNYWEKLKHKIDYFVRQLEKKICGYSFVKGFPFTNEHTGINIISCIQKENPDIIQLHWLGGYFLSPKQIEQILKLGKPVIFVCHDNGHFTGGCHVRMGCERYQQSCGYCPQICSKRKNDWSYRNLNSKIKAYQNDNITVVSPSTWMDGNVTKSQVFKNRPHFVIPNSVNIEIFKPLDGKSLRNKYKIEQDCVVILFGAVNAVDVPYKGYQYLLDALDIFEENYLNNTNKRVQAVVFGSDQGDKREGKSISIKYIGRCNELEMAEAYNLADVYVVPSLEDSFNNTVVESMACEVPVVAFATGGITDIIDHQKNGYLANYKDAADLAKGLDWVINNTVTYKLNKHAREKVEICYTRKCVAKQYVELYKNIMKNIQDAK